MTFGFSAGSSFNNRFGTTAYGTYGQQAAAQPPPFLIGTQTNEFNQDYLQQIHDKFVSGFYGGTGQQGFPENDVFKYDFYQFRDAQQVGTSTFSTGTFGARPGLGAYGQSTAAQTHLSQANNFNLKQMEAQEYRGFSGLYQKLNQTKEDENRIQQKMKEVEEKIATCSQQQRDIFEEVADLNEVYLSLRVLMLGGQEKEQGFYFGFSVALDGFYKRIADVAEKLRKIDKAAVQRFTLDEALVRSVAKIGIQVGKLLE